MGTMDLDHDACYRAVSARDARYDGQFFTAVKTTGIYCRPVCPARTPLSRNVMFFPTAAAAQEAGFHPCLRCRPETAPQLAAAVGGPLGDRASGDPAGAAIVARALSLIEHGALDEGSLDTLAARLGVSDRQLRRHFRAQVGASPVAVAQTRRVLLAKQLIHETQLPMAEIAFAAGFGSIRRFNESFQALFDRPPSALRRSGKPEVPAGPRGEISLLLRYRPPYDWPAMLHFLRVRAIAGMEVAGDTHYARSICLDGVHGTVRVEPGGDSALRVTVRFPALDALPVIIARLRRVFDLASDPLAIGAQLSQDPLLAPLVQARPGLRLPGAWDGFELAMRAVLGQQITVAGAVRLGAKLVQGYGAPMAQAEDGLTHVFPLPEVLAPAQLASLGMPGSRAATLSAVAAAALADPQAFAPQGSLEAAVARLREIKGIGEWTAQYIALRQLREPDAFPAADIGLIRAMEKLDGQAWTAKMLLAHAERWRPWRAYAAQYLWTV
ncbi:ADA regulatory protein / Methylated-DNA--protein-cysteine methyltransferase [Orrella dioscoreae]|uniref:DNA-3-methyladenine glycosylase II n=2 Tax=Orrella dioscoreae TaxID=1851544 RepID=A0A1C3JYC3_9BURK|nr:ADA regulatory protein / Methylated-DNA--protein-cysteine methyltransferase [Orrella dioscoreae]SOE49920.1 ADA regulatory protein / Methylated-DNA--protein-cysteine methyltransferase [Orrella dioscoreae]